MFFSYFLYFFRKQILHFNLTDLHHLPRGLSNKSTQYIADWKSWGIIKIDTWVIMLTLSNSPLVSTSHPVALKTSPSVDRTVSMHSRFLTLHAFGIVQIMSLTPLPSVRYGHYSYSGWELYLFSSGLCQPKLSDGAESTMYLCTLHLHLHTKWRMHESQPSPSWLSEVGTQQKS